MRSNRCTYDQSFQVADGFQLVARQKTMRLETALDWLTQRRQQRHTLVRRSGDEAVLIRHYIQCPCCQAYTSAYLPFCDPYSYCNPGCRFTKAEIRDWADNPTLYPFSQELQFNTPFRGDKFECPRCRRESAPYTGRSAVRIRVQGRRILLTAESMVHGEIGDLLMQAARAGRPLRFPLVETAVFNLPKGRAYVQLADSDGFILRTRDVTDGGNLWWKSSTVYALLSRHRLVCRKLVAAFRLLWNSPLPFPFFSGNGEMTPKDFLALVRFQGYPRSFYDALPYDDQDRIDRTFRLDGKRFRHAERLPALYDASVLPKKKSIRRLFFTHPELFLYRREVETLWTLFAGEIDLFRNLLEREDLFKTLSRLQTYPSIEAFIKDYAATQGHAALLRLLNQRWFPAAVRYAAMSEEGKRLFREAWSDWEQIVQHGDVSYLFPEHSAVWRSKSLKHLEAEIDGFSFRLLKTVNDFRRAGKALNNCLVHWSTQKAPVVVIQKRGQIYAACELDGQTVVQALGPKNTPLSGELMGLLDKWCRRNHFRIRLWIDEYPEDDFELLTDLA